MKTKLACLITAGAMALPALAGYGKDDTQIIFAFGGAGNNVRLYAEVLAQAERDLGGKRVAGMADRLSGHSTGGMLATFLTLPLHAEGRPLSAEETLTHLAKHGPNIYTTLGRGLNQVDKSKVQAEVRKHLGSALGTQSAVKVSELPGTTEVLMVEVMDQDRIPAAFSAAKARSGEVPDATVTDLLTAALSVEMLAGHTPVSPVGAEGKAARVFVDSGSTLRTDPTPGLIEAAVRSGKPAHIFGFEGGYGFEADTLAAEARTREAEQLLAKGIAKDEVERIYGRVRVHLFRSAQSLHQDCAGCVNLDGKQEAMCAGHAPNMVRLVGGRTRAAQTLQAYDARLRAMPLPALALNILHGLADSDINGELSRIAAAQMIGPENGRTPAYAKLLAVLTEAAAAEAPAGTAGSAAPSAGSAVSPADTKATTI